MVFEGLNSWILHLFRCINIFHCFASVILIPNFIEIYIIDFNEIWNQSEKRVFLYREKPCRILLVFILGIGAIFMLCNEKSISFLNSNSHFKFCDKILKNNLNNEF